MSRFSPRNRAPMTLLTLGLWASVAFPAQAQSAPIESAIRARLQDTSLNDGDELGRAVLLYGNTLLASAPGAFEDSAARSGKILSWTRNSAGAWRPGPTIEVPETSSVPGFELANDLGASMALEGFTLVVGAPGSDGRSGTLNTGAAYVYRFDGTRWQPFQRLLGSDSQSSDRFGNAVAINRDTIVVAAREERSQGAATGAVYVFEKKGSAAEPWVQTAKLLAPNAELRDRFGTDIAIEGNRIAVGAPGRAAPSPAEGQPPIPNAGRVFVYERSGNTWTLQSEIFEPESRIGDSLGSEVAFDRGRLIVGVPGRDFAVGLDTPTPTITFDVGEAHAYRQDGASWSKQFTFSPETRRQGEFFGTSIAVEGGRVLIGSAHEDESGEGTGPEAGIAQLWERESGSETWNYLARLGNTPSALPNWGLGRSVALDGELAVMGAFRALEAGIDEDEVGAVAVFDVPAAQVPTTPTPLMPVWTSLLCALGVAGLSFRANRRAF